MTSRRIRSELYLININDYKIIRNINHGGFGTINLVQHKESKERYAAKTNLIQNSSQNKLFISREVRILMQVQHPTIIRFRGFSYEDFEGKKNITILMDYMKEGSLANLIDQESKSLAPPDYDNTKRQIILIGIARGMMILHALHVIHRDLKPENILLDSDFQPHITDFGLSKFFDPHHSMNQSISDAGTAAYMAPEIIVSDHFNTKADVYAFGILMYEILAGKRAFGELLYGRKRLPDYQFKTKIKEGLRPEFDFPIKKGLKKMIECCWSDDPKLRPTFGEIFKKLSLSSDDYFLEFDNCNEEPKIVVDDDEDDDDDENDEEVDLGVVLSKKFCLENVSTPDVLDYVDDIKVEVRNENDSMREEMEKMKKEINEKTALISSLQSEVESVRSELAKVKAQKETEIKSLRQSFARFLSADLSATEPGILGKLVKRQKSPFDKLFVGSQSSNDIYSIIGPESDDTYNIQRIGSFIGFEIENPTVISGVKIYSSVACFPRSFDISVDGKIVKSVKDAAELNGEYKSMVVKFLPIKGQKVRFIIKGNNWDRDSDDIYIKRFEILSKDSRCVFETLINESESKDPHKLPVIVTATYFDLNSFYLLDAEQSVCTFSEANAWFQVELIYGVAIITGFRLKRDNEAKLRKYKIIATDDSRKPKSSWTTLFEINEKKKDENDLLHLFELKEPSPPVKFIRVISEHCWDDSDYCQIRHFDFFGSYF